MPDCTILLITHLLYLDININAVAAIMFSGNILKARKMKVLVAFEIITEVLMRA